MLFIQPACRRNAAATQCDCTQMSTAKVLLELEKVDFQISEVGKRAKGKV